MTSNLAKNGCTPKKKSPPSESAPDYPKRLEDILLQGSMLKEAVSKGLKVGVPVAMLDR
jgi:hypothetical protein